MDKLERVEYTILKIIHKLLVLLFILLFFGGILSAISILLYRVIIFLKTGSWTVKSILDILYNIEMFNKMNNTLNKWTGLEIIISKIPDWIFILIVPPLIGYLIALINNKFTLWIDKTYGK